MDRVFNNLIAMPISKSLFVLCLYIKRINTDESPTKADVDCDLTLNFTLPIQFKKTEVSYNDRGMHTDMMDLVLSILLALSLLAIIFIICCYCMSRSDKKLQNYVLALAKRRGRKLDVKQLKCPTQQANPMAESCPVLLADAGIIIP